MKKFIAILLIFTFGLCSCANDNQTMEKEKEKEEKPVIIQQENDEETLENKEQEILEYKEIIPEFMDLSEPELLRFVEDNVYSGAVQAINNEEYFVENVQAVYVSKEYLEELQYNSLLNVFFGYTLDEVDKQFQGTKYVFTLGEDGKTTVIPLKECSDVYYDVLKNVAIGSGVILVCLTVSAVSAGVGAPAVSMIFAASAKTGTAFAFSSGAIGAVGAGVMTGIQTGDFEEALKAAAVSGSEGFKWGAVGGSILGGAGKAIALHGAALNGLTMNEAALIQKESGYPLELIKQFKSVDEYQVYKNAGLYTRMVDGKMALVRDIDLNYISELPNGDKVTNLARMQKGYAPIDSATGKAYQLHHINQNPEGTLAILTESEHQGNSVILNKFGKESEIDRNAFDKVRKEFWKKYAQHFL